MLLIKYYDTFVRLTIIFEWNVNNGRVIDKIIKEYMATTVLSLLFELLLFFANLEFIRICTKLFKYHCQLLFLLSAFLCSRCEVTHMGYFVFYMLIHQSNKYNAITITIYFILNHVWSQHSFTNPPPNLMPIKPPKLPNNANELKKEMQWKIQIVFRPSNRNRSHNSKINFNDFE